MMQKTINFSVLNKDTVRFHDDSTCVVARIRNLVVLIWRDSPTIAGLESTDHAIKEAKQMLADNQRVALLSIIESHAGRQPPSVPVKERLQLLLSDNREILCASAVVFEGTGFKAAIVRSVISIAEMAARSTFQRAVFSTVESAIAWLFSTNSTSLAPLDAKDVDLAISRLKASTQSQKMEYA